MVWPILNLGEVCGFQNGFAFKSKLFTESGTPVLRISNIQGGAIDLSKIVYTDPQSYKEELGRYHVRDGDLLIAMSGATTGKIGVNSTGLSFLLNQRVGKFLPSNKLDKQYLYYYLTTKVEKHLEISAGAAQPNLSTEQIKAIKIPLPSLSEQKGIVAILDQVFAEIEKARATAETNLKNARELFDSYLQQVFSQRGEGWETHKLKNITSKIGSGATPRGGKEAYKDVGMSLIRSMNIHDRVFKEKNLALIDDEQAAKLNNVELLENDILLNITGASVARCCVIPKEVLPGRVNQHVSIIRVDKSVIEPSLLCFILTSKFYKDKLLGIGESGSTRQAITKVQIENFEIVFPQDLDEQKKLLKDLEALELKMLKLQDIYIKKSQSLVELKSSILQKAFTGELTKSKGIAA
jgi:type I restriction enzyme S subunit